MFCPSFDGQEELAVCTDICQDLRTFEFAESNFSKLLHYSVKGRLKASIEFWRFIGAPKFILDIISDGYKIPFITTPPPVHLKNNGSALEHSDFVNDAILELLQDNRIEELTTPPEIVNPLTVSVQSSGKKRLILDLRHINLHVFKQKFKCEGLHTIRDIFSADYFVFSFDLKSGYHHVDIFPDHRKFLAFSWHFGTNCVRYFQFTVLPFGLSSAPFIFTKLIKPLEAFWRLQGIPIAIFFDDGVGAGSSRDIAESNGSVVRSSLAQSGFLVNQEKSDWNPKNIFSWIGFIINTRSGLIYAIDARIESLCCALNELCAGFEVSASIHVKRLASIVGKIISLSPCCGNVTQIMTRYLHLIVNSRDSWHSIVFLQDQAKKELLFWRDNLRNLNGASFWSTPFVPSKIVFSDASSTGCAAYIQSSSLLFHRNWSATESLKSSTWRELATVKYSLEAFNNNLAGHRVRWNTDNQNVVRIVQVGSMIEELQELALDIFLFASSHNIRLDLTWIPRDQNSEADRFSKVVDIDDYSVHDDVFIHLDRLWGPHSIDRFASSYNAKLPRFNSRFLQSGTEAVDAFSQDWSCDNNWIVPPATVVGKVLNHMRESKAVGTLIVPMWKSSYFWPLLCNDGMHLSSFVKHWLCLPKRPDLFVAGRAKNKLFGTKAFKSPCLALRIDFLQPERLSPVGFCTSPLGHCSVCQP